MSSAERKGKATPWFFLKLQPLNLDGLVKSHKSDGTVKSSRCKARESLGMRRTYQYAAVTKDEAQRRRWTFYEAVNLDLLRGSRPRSIERRDNGVFLELMKLR